MLYAVTNQNIAFLLHESCRATIRNINGNSISASQRTQLKASFSSFQTFCFYFLTLQDKHNINTLSINKKYFHLLLSRSERIFFLFLKLVQLHLIFSDKVRTLYIVYLCLLHLLIDHIMLFLNRPNSVILMFNFRYNSNIPVCIYLLHVSNYICSNKYVICNITMQDHNPDL